MHDRGVAGGEVAVDGGNQRRRFHRRDQMTEEALFRALESRARGGLGLSVERPLGSRDVGGFQRRVEIVVNDCERPGIGVVDADLLFTEAMLEHFIFDALVGQRARGIEAEAFQIPGQRRPGRCIGSAPFG